MNRILHENSKKYYKQCKALFIKDIKERKLKLSKSDIIELKLLNDYNLNINNWSKINTYDSIVFLLFKFYYIIKQKDNHNLEHRLKSLFWENKDNIMIDHINYIRMFYIIIDKIIINSDTKKHLFICIFIFNIESILYDTIQYFNLSKIFFEFYIEHIETMFFYNFFFITDLNTYIIKSINKSLKSKYSKIDESVITLYMQSLENILSWSILREIWIYLCIFAKPQQKK